MSKNLGDSRKVQDEKFLPLLFKALFEPTLNQSDLKDKPDKPKSV